MWCLRALVKIKNFLTSLCFERERDPNKNIKVPWIWIGGTTNDGSIIDLTRYLSTYLDEGDLVTEYFLSKIEPKCIAWSYIDFKTLNEVKIPVSGIQI
jgi:hypothetical protein